METMPATYANALENIIPQSVGTVSAWQPSRQPQSFKARSPHRHSKSTIPTPGQMHWRSLTMQAHYGNKNAYVRLLREIDDWLEVYLLRIGFEGDYDMLIIDILLALHDKIGTYNPKFNVVSWLMAIADFKLASAGRSTSDQATTVGPFLVSKKRSPWMGALS